MTLSAGCRNDVGTDRAKRGSGVPTKAVPDISFRAWIMAPYNLVGQRVRVLAWDDLRDVLPAEPRGTVTRVVDFGAEGVELTVRIEGMVRSFLFGLDEVEVVSHPGPADAESG